MDFDRWVAGLLSWKRSDTSLGFTFFGPSRPRQPQAPVLAVSTAPEKQQGQMAMGQKVKLWALGTTGFGQFFFLPCNRLFLCTRYTHCSSFSGQNSGALGKVRGAGPRTTAKRRGTRETTAGKPWKALAGWTVVFFYVFFGCVLQPARPCLKAPMVVWKSCWDWYLRELPSMRDAVSFKEQTTRRSTKRG